MTARSETYVVGDALMGTLNTGRNAALCAGRQRDDKRDPSCGQD